jgi:hypothetical protein
MPETDCIMKKEALPKGNIQKAHSFSPSSRTNCVIQVKKNPVPVSSNPGLRKDEINSLKEAAAAVHQIKLSAQNELELRTRLATQRETEELIRQASEEIQKVLADIRMIRIMAQEELAAQRKFTDAAKLRTMSMAIQDGFENIEVKKKKPMVSVK